jgi:DNA modification methylase
MPLEKQATHTKPANKSGSPVKLKATIAKAAKSKTPLPAQSSAEIKKPKEQVTIAKLKGRPMLSWVGKRPLRAVTAFPAQHIESFIAPAASKVTVANAVLWKEWPDTYPRGGLLFHGDNKEVLAHLLASGFRGQVQLIYIDPPFDSGADYVRKIALRGPQGSVKLEGESYTLGEQIQYTDIWANDNYLQFMYERLILLKELLANNGSIVVHANTAKGHHIRCLLDEIMGERNMRSEITWHYDKYQMGKTKQFVDNTDRLFWYSKGDAWTYNLQTEKLDKPKQLLAKGWDSKKGVIVNLRNNEGKTYKIVVDTKKIDDFWELPQVAPFRARVESETDTFTTILLDEMPVDNTWLIPYIAAPSFERTGYPTQKPEALIERILKACAKTGDLVLDCFCGSGTTLAVAQNLGLRWIGADINKGAIQTTTKRVLAVIDEQIATARHAGQQQRLLDDEPVAAPIAQLGFTVHRVNDYDLAIQHNEAVNVACDHVGITRTLADTFFDGTIGNKLAKIVPFGHPLSPADLEEVKRELSARANESRDVVVVCLGKELGVDVWLTEWNRVRKQGDAPNKIEVIELRSDPKYGKFIAHEPAMARVDIRRVKAKDGDKLVVEVKDFVSPSVVERLQGQAGLLAPKITDWRAMVDSVIIDPAYNSKVFNIVLADVPERKKDYIKARYELPAPTGKTTVAVKITDMLGEEAIVTSDV